MTVKCQWSQKKWQVRTSAAEPRSTELLALDRTSQATRLRKRRGDLRSLSQNRRLGLGPPPLVGPLEGSYVGRRRVGWLVGMVVSIDCGVVR